MACWAVARGGGDMRWPEVRGTLTGGRSLAELSWLRAGGPAEMLFQPADVEDLRDFLPHVYSQ